MPALRVQIAQVIEDTREQHRAEVARHSSASLENEKLEEAVIVGDKRLKKIEDKLEAEILARKQSEQKLKEQKKKTSRLWIGLVFVSAGACMATGVAIYYKKAKPRVVLVQGGGAPEAGDQQDLAVQNTTVVMGRAVTREPEKGADAFTDVDLAR